jgi:hypothetical protein
VWNTAGVNLTNLIPQTGPTADASDGTRSIHLVDVENLLGGAAFTKGDAAATAAVYASVATVAARDHMVVASSHFAAPAAWFGWGHARRVVRSGPDGADLALLGIIENENLAVRFDRIVIASGDKIFAEAAARLQGVGAKVTVVSRVDSLSRQLRLAVRDVRYLDAMPEVAPDIARRVA